MTDKPMGRPKLEDKKRMVCVYLRAREWERVDAESREEGIPKSQVIERILINRNYQKYPRQKRGTL